MSSDEFGPLTDKDYTCYYCHTFDKKIEARGIYYCPNPMCTGPGIQWFNRKLSSYKEEQRGYSVDSLEQAREALKYADTIEIASLRDRIRSDAMAYLELHNARTD